MNDPHEKGPDSTSFVIRRREMLTILAALALPATRMAGVETIAKAAVPSPSPASAAPADLANFHPMMEWLAKENAPKLSFEDARWSSLEEWKRAARPVFRAALSYNPKPVPMSSRLLATEQRDGFTVESVSIAATPAYEIPARVLS